MLLVVFLQTSLSFAALNLPTPAEQMAFVPPITESVVPNALGVPPTWGLVTLANVPPGYSVTTGNWRGWCVDASIGITPGVPYLPIMYDTTDPTFPNAGNVWNKINYIVNHKGAYNVTEIQAAIWRFTNPPAAAQESAMVTGNYLPQYGFPAANPANINAIVADANANGASYVPAPGEVVLVYLDVPVPPNVITRQPVVIEVVSPPCTGQIGDFVWRDTNANGLQNLGEPGINGVKVELYQGVTKIAEVTTATFNGQAGYYQFTGVCDGTYQVVVDGTTIPNGLIQTTVPGSSNGNDGVGNDSNNPAGTNVTLGQVAGRNIQTIDFGFKDAPCTGSIGDFVWNDLNHNGCQDPGEPGIQGVTVNLYTGCNPNPLTLVGTTATDANGKYLFSNLCAGGYTVSFVTPNGFTRTLANQACTVGGKPADETDSDCDCAGDLDCGICVVLLTNSSVNLTIDCGYVSNTPCVTLTKTPANPTAAPGASMVYTYVIKNCGGTPLTNLAIIDDNATPGDTSDDFTVASGIALAPAETKTFTATVILPTPLCTGSGSPPASAGTLTTVVLPSGDIQVTLTQSRTLNDNVYGTPAPADGWAGGHSFGNLTGSDKAEFRFTNGSGAVVLDFFLDYISAATSKTFPSGTVSYPSGYGTLGANGGDGSLVAGSLTNLLFATTSLTDNLNQAPAFYGYTVNSPTPESSFPTWDYADTYTVIVSKNAFGAAGFGGVTIPNIHNSPAKTGSNQVTPTPCGDCFTNRANVYAVVGGNIVGQPLATSSATVCVGAATPPCMITPGTFKIDKKTVQLPLQNNGAADISLSQVQVNWNQAVNGNLVKMSLNGDFWVGSVPSGTLVNTGFNADATRRKIAKGQMKTLVLTFANNASTTVGSYSGTIKFGSDPSCAVAFPPPTPPTPFSCDGHIATLKMKWAGSQNIKVVAHYGSTVSTAVLATIDNVTPGTVVTVGSYAGSPNDVIWEIFQAGTNTKIGESQFHVSCSDSTMDGPEDCGSAQGNGKQNIATYLNNWTFVGLTTIKGTTLTCP